LQYCVAEVKVLDAHQPVNADNQYGAGKESDEYAQIATALDEELAMITEAAADVESDGELAEVPPALVANAERFFTLLHNTLVDYGPGTATVSEALLDGITDADDETMLDLTALHSDLVDSDIRVPVDAIQKHFSAYITESFGTTHGDTSAGEPHAQCSAFTSAVSAYGTWVELRLKVADAEGCVGVGEFYDFITRKSLEDTGQPSPDDDIFNDISHTGAYGSGRSALQENSTSGTQWDNNDDDSAARKTTSRLHGAHQTDWDSPRPRLSSDPAEELFRSQSRIRMPRLSIDGSVPGEEHTSDGHLTDVSADDVPPVTPAMARELRIRSAAPSPLDRPDPKHPLRVNLATGRVPSFRVETERGRVKRVMASILNYLERLQQVANSSPTGVFPEDAARTLIPLCFSDIQQAYAVPIASLQEQLGFLYVPCDSTHGLDCVCLLAFFAHLGSSFLLRTGEIQWQWFLTCMLVGVLKVQRCDDRLWRGLWGLVVFCVVRVLGQGALGTGPRQRRQLQRS
jgi:hypothetical protein